MSHTTAQPHGAENTAQNSISSLGTRAGPCIKLFSLNIILGLQRTKKSHQNRICILPNEIACRYVGPLLQGPLYSFSQTMEDESASDETKIDLSVNCPEVKLTLRSATQSLIKIQVKLTPYPLFKYQWNECSVSNSHVKCSWHYKYRCMYCMKWYTAILCTVL